MKLKDMNIRDLIFIIVITSIISTLIVLGVLNHVLRNTEQGRYFYELPGELNETRDQALEDIERALNQSLAEIEQAKNQTLADILENYPDTVIGPEGPPGPQGEPGPEGPRGPIGMQGPPGEIYYVEVTSTSGGTTTPSEPDEPVEDPPPPEANLECHWDVIEDNPLIFPIVATQTAETLTLSVYSGGNGTVVLLWGGILNPFVYEITTPPDYRGEHYLWIIDRNTGDVERSDPFTLE